MAIANHSYQHESFLKLIYTTTKRSTPEQYFQSWMFALDWYSFTPPIIITDLLPNTQLQLKPNQETPEYSYLNKITDFWLSSCKTFIYYCILGASTDLDISDKASS